MAQSVFKNKDYVLLFLGSLVSNMGTAVYNFSISLYILHLTGDVAKAGIYMSFGGLVFFAFALFGGAIVDRLNKVAVVFMTDYLNGAVILIAAFLIFSGLETRTTIIVLYIVSFILGMNSALFNPAARSLPAHILEEEQLQQSSSLMQGMGAIYGIVGTMLGGVLYAFVSIEAIFIINGVSFVLSGVSESFIRTNTKPDEEHKLTFKSTVADIGRGFKYIFGIKPILNIIVIAAFLNFFTVPVIVNGFPYLFEIVLEAEPYYYSTIMAVYPVGVIIASLRLGTTQQKERVSPLIITGLVGMAFSFLLFAGAVFGILGDYINFATFMIIASIMGVIMGWFNGYVNIPFSVAIMKRADKTMLGKVFSVVSIITNGLTPIAIGLGGFAIKYLGLSNLFILAIVAMFVTALLAKTNGPISEL